MSKNSLTKMFLVYPSSYKKLQNYNQDDFFINKKLLSILLNNKLKDNYKWYQIRQQLLQYAHLKRNNQTRLSFKKDNSTQFESEFPEQKFKNSQADSSTQTKFLFKKDNSTQFDSKNPEIPSSFVNEKIYEDDSDIYNNVKKFTTSAAEANNSRKRKMVNEYFDNTLTDYKYASEQQLLKKSKDDEKGYKVIQDKDGTVYTIVDDNISEAPHEEVVKEKYRPRHPNGPTDRILRNQSEKNISWHPIK